MGLGLDVAQLDRAGYGVLASNSAQGIASLNAVFPESAVAGSSPAIQSPKPFQEAIMTNREHKKLLRAIRHQQGMRESQQLAKKIDRAFSRISENCSNRVVMATSLGSLRDKPAQEEITERRNRIWYKQPGERGITCSGRQKMKLTSKPLI